MAWWNPFKPSPPKPAPTPSPDFGGGGGFGGGGAGRSPTEPPKPSGGGTPVGGGGGGGGGGSYTPSIPIVPTVPVIDLEAIKLQEAAAKELEKQKQIAARKALDLKMQQELIGAKKYQQTQKKPEVFSTIKEQQKIYVEYGGKVKIGNRTYIGGTYIPELGMTAKEYADTLRRESVQRGETTWKSPPSNYILTYSDSNPQAEKEYRDAASAVFGKGAYTMTLEDLNKLTGSYNEAIQVVQASVIPTKPFDNLKKAIESKTQSISPVVVMESDRERLSTQDFISKYGVHPNLEDYPFQKQVDPFLKKHGLYEPLSKFVNQPIGINVPTGLLTSKTVAVSDILTPVEETFPSSKIITEMIPRTFGQGIEAGAFIYTYGKAPTQMNLAISGIGVSELKEGDYAKGIREITFGAVLPALSYLKAPIEIYRTPKSFKVESIEQKKLFIKDEQGIDVGQYLIKGQYPERFVYTTTRGKILMDMISPLKVKPQSFETFLDFYTTKNKISGVKVVVSKTEPLIMKEGEIIGSLKSGGTRPVEVFTQTATESRMSGITKSYLKGRMNMGQEELAKINLLSKDKVTQAALRDILNLPKEQKISKTVKTETLAGDLFTDVNVKQLTNKLNVVQKGSPINLQMGEVELFTFAKETKTSRTYTGKTPITTKLISGDKISSNIIESIYGKKITPKNRLDKGQLTSIEKSIFKQEFDVPEGVIEREVLRSMTAVTSKIPKELLIVKEGKVSGILKYDTFGRSRVKIKGLTFAETIQLPSSTEKFSSLARTKPFESKYGAKSVSDILKEAGLNEQIQIQRNRIDAVRLAEIKKASALGGKNIVGSLAVMQKGLASPRAKTIAVKSSTSLIAPTILSMSRVSAQEKSFTNEMSKVYTGDLFKESVKPSAKEITKSIPREISREIVREVPREISREISREIVREVPREISREISKQVPRMISKQITKQQPKKKIITIFTPIRTPNKTKITGGLNLKSLSGIGKGKSFRVLARRYGKFRTIGLSSDVKKAFAIGEKYTRGSLGATFKVEGAGAISGTPTGFYAKDSKKYGRLYIQKSKFRLSSAGEKSEIKLSKLMKGGLRV